MHKVSRTLVGINQRYITVRNGAAGLVEIQSRNAQFKQFHLLLTTEFYRVQCSLRPPVVSTGKYEGFASEFLSCVILCEPRPIALWWSRHFDSAQKIIFHAAVLTLTVNELFVR